MSNYYDNVVSGYQNTASKYDSDESAETKLESKGAVQSFSGTSMRFDGTVDNGLQGSVVIIKINDRTAIIQTDSEIYMDDYNKVIESLVRNNML